MTINDTFGLSLRNLRQAKLRTALTTLGVSIGIASLAGMVSLGVGLQDQVVARFTQSGLFGAITVTTQNDLAGPLAQLGRRGRAVARPPTPGSKPAVKLDAPAVKEIAALPNVQDVFPNLRIPVELSLDEFSRPLVVAGVPMSSKGTGAFQTFRYGQFFKNDSDNGCIVTLDAAKRISQLDPASLIGKALTLSYAAANSEFQVRRVDFQCPVVGIIERDTVTFSPVMIPLGVARKIDAEMVINAQSLVREQDGARSYGSVTVKVTRPQFTQDVEDRLVRMGYSVVSMDDALRGAKSAFIILDIFLTLIGSIALTVSSLGIVNTMVMSILERTREIGIMKAIGASDNDIRRIFLVEACAIGIFGGITGIAIGWTVGRIINFAANRYIQSQGGVPGTLFSLPLWLIAGAMAFSVAVSLAAGSYPASRAARLDPIRALRHD